MPEKVEMKKRDTERADRTMHSPEEVLRVLSIYKLTQSPTIASERTGVPYSTVQRWVGGDVPFKFDDANMLSAFEKREILTVSFLKDEALQQVYRRLPDASAAQAATIYGILADKQIAMKSINEHKSDNTFIFADSSLSMEDKLSIIERVAARSRPTATVTSAEPTAAAGDAIDVEFDVVDDATAIKEESKSERVASLQASAPRTPIKEE